MPTSEPNAIPIDLRADDALLLLAYGRAYAEVVTVFDEARRTSLPVVLVTDSFDREEQT